MKNAAELAIAEFNIPNIQLLVKDDGGTPQGAQPAAQQAIDEGAEIILGPLFAQSVQAVGQVARPRGIPVIAFSTDANVAARGIYLLSFLPESDVHRIVDYAFANGKRSFAALVPDNAYGSVVEAAFQRSGGAARRPRRRDSSAMRPISPSMQAAVQDGRPVARAGRCDLHCRTAPTPFRRSRKRWQSAGVNTQPRAIARHRLVGRSAHLRRYGIAAAAGIRRPIARASANFSQRYRQRYGQDPVRTATLVLRCGSACRGAGEDARRQRFTPEVLTNPSGFAGIDGVFRFRRTAPTNAALRYAA